MGNMGDTFEIATCLRDVGGVRPNSQVITWAVTATAPYTGVGALHAAWEAALPTLLAVMSDGVEARGAFYKQWLPVPGSRVGYQFSPPPQGGVSAQNLPLASCAEVLKRSGLQGRNLWGRLYLPWLPVQYEDPAVPNKLVEVDRLAIEQACYDLDAALQAGATGSAWRSVVISRRSATTPGVYATPVSSFVCMEDFRALAQRGRRDYRCPFDERYWSIAPFDQFAARRTLPGNWVLSSANPLNWRYWLNGGSRGGDDGPVDPDWTLPTFDASAWHGVLNYTSPGYRLCPDPGGPGGVNWPRLMLFPNTNDPPGFERTSHYHYFDAGGGVPNGASPHLFTSELDYYRCTFKVTGITHVHSAFLRHNYLDGVAHYINGTEVWNNLGSNDIFPPGCRDGEETDILSLLDTSGGLNCWGVIHQPGGGGTSIRPWNRYAPNPPQLYDTWWAGEIRVGGTNLSG